MSEPITELRVRADETRLEVERLPHHRVFRFLGTVTDRGLRGCLEAVREDPDYVHDRGELFDFEHVNGQALSVEGMRSLALLGARGEAPRHRTAILTASAPGFAFARVYVAWAPDGDEKLRVFRSREAALAWLDVEG